MKMLLRPGAVLCSLIHLPHSCFLYSSSLVARATVCSLPLPSSQRSPFSLLFCLGGPSDPLLSSVLTDSLEQGHGLLFRWLLWHAYVCGYAHACVCICMWICTYIPNYNLLSLGNAACLCFQSWAFGVGETIVVLFPVRTGSPSLSAFLSCLWDTVRAYWPCIPAVHPDPPPLSCFT